MVCFRSACFNRDVSHLGTCGIRVNLQLVSQFEFLDDGLRAGGLASVFDFDV